ncbi:hypothetical protein EH31_07120 [Erythrobacter longus]|uniref:Uncharacterized protein n=1 Tax=Erythrobacter longus TaxID=1044 RepID=A0A074MYS6_ERYLO|nr:hypothetical protein [Erythrobacter longus]KEO90802.1 hypothetical protein EH31_07120 [Erythrobacter longus]
MTTIGFLACETTLPGSQNRREDAFEHDLMVEAITPAFARRGWTFKVIDWEAPMEAFADVDLVMIGSSWNYWDKVDAFLTKLEALAKTGITVCNSPEVARWNIRKTYLGELEQRGARTIPTLWLDALTADDAAAAMDQFGCDKLVVKRQIGAGAEGQEMLERGQVSDDWRYTHKAMVQPFLPAIAQSGELSFLFFGGVFSHCVQKLPKDGDYRIQSLYGGREVTHEPSAQEIAQAAAIIEALPFAPPLYARIDMLEGEDAKLMVMEAELIEPYLYPEQGPNMGESLAQAIAKELDL